MTYSPLLDVAKQDLLQYLIAHQLNLPQATAFLHASHHDACVAAYLTTLPWAYQLVSARLYLQALWCQPRTIGALR